MRAFAAALLLCCASLAAPQSSPPGPEAVVTTELGTFRFEFAPDAAPKHVEAFIARAREGYYNGSAFFRMAANGMIQGGDPLLKSSRTPRNLWGTGGLSLLPGEFSSLKHERGVVSTVSIPNRPNSDGAQFFVCVTGQPSLDGKYSAFGRITEGMDVVERISQIPVDKDGVAEKPVRIVSVAIEPKKVEPFLGASVDELRRTVTMETTLGLLKIQMEPDWAPENARTFLKLAATGWYDGTAFHRIAKGFVIQGGTAQGRRSGPTHPADRWVRNVKGEFRNDVKHVRGVVSMAHGDDPDSGNTSFFIALGDASNLDGKYSAFGRVIEGMDVLAAFEMEEVDGETPKRRLEIVKAAVGPM